jgi:hypothetical protein
MDGTNVFAGAHGVNPDSSGHETAVARTGTVVDVAVSGLRRHSATTPA